MHKLVFLGLLTLVIVGCGKSPKAVPVEMVPLEQVPETVMKSARERLPDVKFDTAWKNQKNGKQIYEIRGKTAAGKTLEVEVTPEGEVVEVE
jgi:hypothetical protein